MQTSYKACLHGTDHGLHIVFCRGLCPTEAEGGQVSGGGIAIQCYHLSCLFNTAALSHPGTASKTEFGITYEPLPSTELQI